MYSGSGSEVVGIVHNGTAAYLVAGGRLSSRTPSCELLNGGVTGRQEGRSVGAVGLSVVGSRTCVYERL